jgi:drug/metabolite transporter (DMT)-like permease
MSARAWTSFAAVSTLWGIPYLFIKVAVDDGVPPAFLAFVRIALGAAVLMALAWRAGALGPLRGRWRWLAVYAIFEIAVPFPLIAAGEQRIASSLAAIIIASVPLFVALLALRFDRAERATGSRLVGLFMGLAGVVALVGIDVAGRGSELIGAAAVLVAAVGYAAGPMVFKRKLADLDPRAAMGASLVIAAVALAPLAAVDPPTAVPSARAILALVVLGILCTAAAFVFFGVLIAEVGPGRGLVITYIAPVVAVTLGVTVLGERPGAGAVAGLLLILAGSWLSTDGRLPPPLVAIVTRVRSRRVERRVERRSHPMNAPSAWTSCWTTAAGSRSSIASALSRR